MAESLPNIDGLAPELKSFVVQVLEENARLKAEMAALREELARLKGLKGRPQLKPSGMEKSTEAQAKGKRKPGRRGPKRPRLTINETKIIKAENIEAGSRFKGYDDFIVQDVIVQPRTVLYRRERWQLPSGETVVAPLPAGTVGHFGAELKRFVISQYVQGQVTVPRLVQLLNDLGMVISRAFYEMVESEGDSRESLFVIQASHWAGGQHEWGSHTRKTCDAVSFKRLRRATPTKRLPTSVA